MAVLVCGLTACASTSENDESADPDQPYSWTCPEEAVRLPAGTQPDDHFRPISGNAVCEGLTGCTYHAFIPCSDEDDTAWRYDTGCACVKNWFCDTSHWYRDYCTPPPVYTCPQGLQSYGSGQEYQLLPSGPCTFGASCELTTRESCDDGSTGVTSSHSCSCPGGGLASWTCRKDWSTSASCGVPAGPGEAETVSGGSDYWIRVEGDGAPYELRGSPEYMNPASCGVDPQLTGCYRDGLVPCLSTAVTPTSSGTYIDRNGDAWQLTSTSIIPAAGQDSIGAPRAEGVLEANALGPGGATLHLVFTFQAEYGYFTC